MINALVSITFACGLIIAFLRVINRKFIAPVYDVFLNLTKLRQESHLLARKLAHDHFSGFP